MMRRLLACVLFAYAAGTAAAQSVPACAANEMKLTFGGQDGEFTGMSHDGAWLTVRNVGKRTCSVPKRPALTMTDGVGKPVNAKLNVPPGMHPGPVLVPVALKPGQMAKGKMQWVIGEVYDHSVCVDVAGASFKAQDGIVSAPLKARMCGQASDGAHYEEEWLQVSK